MYYLKLGHDLNVLTTGTSAIFKIFHRFAENILAVSPTKPNSLVLVHSFTQLDNVIDGNR